MDSNTLQSTVSKTWVGTLVQWNPRTDRESNPLEIYSESEVFIGRNAKTCQYHLSSQYVSNKHVRIYSVLYDESGLEVPPLVYAQDLSLNVTHWNGFPMGNTNGSFLLSDGDTLTIVPDVYVRYHSAGSEGDNQLSSIQRSETRAFNSYEVTPRVLGFGAYGRVHMAFKKDSGQQLACKIINLAAFSHRVLKDPGDDKESRSLSGPQVMVDSPKRGTLQTPHPKGTLAEEKVACFRREARILAAMSHPNIVRLERVFQSSRTMYIFSELVTGGDLYSFIRSQQERLDDQTSAFIVRQVLLAVNYLHDQNVMHRDIKPDNILLTSPTEGGRVVLSDFGCARKFDLSTRRKYSVVGTPEYCAPEIRLQQVGYTKAADLWSLGCVTAVLLTGSPAFDGQSDHIAQELVELKTYLKELEVDEWATDFVLNLLVRDVNKRLTAKEALCHFWFTNPVTGPEVQRRCRAAIQHWTPKRLERPEIVDIEEPKTPHYHRPSVSKSTGGPEQEQDHSIDHVSESSYGDPPEGDTKALMLHPSLTCQLPGQDFAESTTPPDRNLHPPDPPRENASPRESWTPRESPTGKKNPEFLSDIRRLESPKPGMLVQMAIRRPPEAKAPLQPSETSISMRLSLFKTSPGLNVDSLEDPFLSPGNINIPPVLQPRDTNLSPRLSLFKASASFKVNSLESPFLSPGSINISPVGKSTEHSLPPRLSLFNASPGLKVDLLQNPLLTPGSINRPPSTSPTRKHALPTEGKGATDDLEQVYEVVHNPMTGKRTRRIYGQDVEDLDDLQG